jgi:hypothetical protein
MAYIQSFKYGYIAEVDFVVIMNYLWLCMPFSFKNFTYIFLLQIVLIKNYRYHRIFYSCMNGLMKNVWISPLRTFQDICAGNTSSPSPSRDAFCSHERLWQQNYVPINFTTATANIYSHFEFNFLVLACVLIVLRVSKNVQHWKVLSSGIAATCFHANFLLGLFFDPEDGGDMFLRNVGWLSMDYTALYSRR